MYMYVCMTSRNSITSPPDVAIHNAKVGSIGTDVSDVMTNVDVRMCEGESCVSVCEFALRESMLTFCLCAFCTRRDVQHGSPRQSVKRVRGIFFHVPLYSPHDR